MNYLSVFLLFCLAMPVEAQSTFTGHLRKAESGKGVVVIVQNDAIENAVNQHPAENSAKGKSNANTPSPKVKPTPENVHQNANRDGGHESHATASHGKHLGEPSSNAGNHVSDGASKHYAERARRKARGFRICIFMGGNSRADREKAVAIGNKCRAQFPELAVYPSFVSPRWVTYVGDFRTRQDAQKYVSRIRSARLTYEVRIVSSDVNLPY